MNLLHPEHAEQLSFGKNHYYSYKSKGVFINTDKWGEAHQGSAFEKQIL